MQATHLTHASGQKIAVPRAAIWIGNAAAAVWRGLEAIGHSRAQHAMREVAARLDITDPALAAQVRANLRASLPRD
jgi:hypothetical protein